MSRTLTMIWRRPVNPVLFFGLIALAGCGPRQSDSVHTPDELAPRHNPGSERPSGATDSAREPVPTELQREAVQTITSAGGRVEFDAHGLPVLIDLASERVFADEAAVSAVLAFPDLKRLRLAVSTVEPEMIGRLKSLTQLHEFLLQDASIDDSVLEELLRAMPALQRLTLRRLSRITDAGVATATACAELEVLALIEMNLVTGATLDQLPRIKRLRSLDLRNCGQLSNDDVAKLEALDGLQELKIGGPMANDDVLAKIERLASITSLTIEDGDVTGAGLQQLAKSSALAGRLRSISFARCFGVTDDALAVLGQFPKLETIALRDIMVTGSFLNVLRESGDSPLPLKTLVVTQAFLTDETMEHLPDVAPNLIHLDLRGNLGITDQSLDGFRKLRSLELLRLEETGVTSRQGVTSSPL